MVVNGRLEKFFRICIYVTVTFIATTSCNKEASKELLQSLKLSGSNKTELEKVLDHYQNDSLEFKAARFLIKNMFGSYSQNSDIVEICSPFYEEYNSLAKEYNYAINTRRGQKIDSLWSTFSTGNPQLRNLPFQLDLETISAKQLITEIDLAFKVWQENVYTKDCSFDEFCEYILPYRRLNGLVIDSARVKFYERHKGQYFTQPGKDMIDEADSLLYEYRHLTHSQFWGTKIPILTASTFEQLRHGLCEQRCWYNSLLFSSLGMAAAVDFVPAWGNRNNNHTWNVLIKDGKSYAFEAFWDNDRWKYKRIYNNETFDYDWGRFRLAKVYRQSFKNFPEGPITDKRIYPDDIPQLFRNIKKKDVSHEYFDTVNVTVRLSETPKNTHYAYLCVWNFHNWQPAQWGKIKKGNVVFEGMGKDVIYLPCYYKNGTLIYAGSPFLLNQYGEIEYFNSNLNNKEDLYIKHYAGAPLHYGNKWNNISIGNTVIYGSKTLSFENLDTLCVFPDSIDIYGSEIPISLAKPVRYIRVTLPYKKIAYSDLSFFKNENGKSEKITGVNFINTFEESENGENPSFIFDEYKATGYKKEINTNYIDIDLGDEYLISDISFTPYFEAGLKENLEFELYYWNNGWQSLGKKQGSNKHIVFRDVPQNALFILKHPDRNNRPGSRPFIYRNNEVLWH